MTIKDVFEVVHGVPTSLTKTPIPYRDILEIMLTRGYIIHPSLASEEIKSYLLSQPKKRRFKSIYNRLKVRDSFTLDLLIDQCIHWSEVAPEPIVYDDVPFKDGRPFYNGEPHIINYELYTTIRPISDDDMWNAALAYATTTSKFCYYYIPRSDKTAAEILTTAPDKFQQLPDTIITSFGTYVTLIKSGILNDLMNIKPSVGMAARAMWWFVTHTAPTNFNIKAPRIHSHTFDHIPPHHFQCSKDIKVLKYLTRTTCDSLIHINRKYCHEVIRKLPTFTPQKNTELHDNYKLYESIMIRRYLRALEVRAIHPVRRSSPVPQTHIGAIPSWPKQDPQIYLMNVYDSMVPGHHAVVLFPKKWDITISPRIGVSGYPEGSRYETEVASIASPDARVMFMSSVGTVMALDDPNAEIEDMLQENFIIFIERTHKNTATLVINGDERLTFHVRTEYEVVGVVVDKYYYDIHFPVSFEPYDGDDVLYNNIYAHAVYPRVSARSFYRSIPGYIDHDERPELPINIDLTQKR